MASCENPNGQDEVMIRRRLPSKVCLKCKLQPGRVVIRHAVYCRSCFGGIVGGRVRAALSPSSVGKASRGPKRKSGKSSQRENVLIALSGGLSSTVMLDLVERCCFRSGEDAGLDLDAQDLEQVKKGGTAHPRNNNMWKKGYICYVEVCGAFDEMPDKTEAVRDMVGSRYGTTFDFVPLRLEDAFDSAFLEFSGNLSMDPSVESLPISLSSTDSTPISALRSFLQALPAASALPTAISTLTRLLLLYTAKRLECSKLLMGTSLTSLAIGLLAGIGEGGGGLVDSQVGETWSDNVQVVKPLLDVGLKELALWAYWNNMPVVGRRKFIGGERGLGGLTRDFIVALEKDYPSTVSTIARTCGKLKPKLLQLSDTTPAASKCAFCQRFSQLGISTPWKERIAIRSFSASNAPPDSIAAYLLDDEEEGESTPVEPTETDPAMLLAPHLCYLCHTMFTSRGKESLSSSSSSTVPLPVWVTTPLQIRL
ncbi:hypothetical protein C8J56DRAFT_490456 [Mycena floridula]|nr:hypothetical protein C8J56DRAFT_490456 [Mycena floridula]